MTIPFRYSVLLLFLAFADVVHAAGGGIEFFSPEGEVKSVRQVSVRFSESMMPFGDSRQLDPFDIDCPEKGSGRWADDRNWIYDFESDLPGGLQCSFTIKKDLKSLSGNAIIADEPFTFNTGGPAIKQSLPSFNRHIDEHQAFILGLDTPATRDSVQQHAYCVAQGIEEHIPIQLIEGDDRRQILKIRQDYLTSWYRTVFRRRGILLNGVIGIANKGNDEEKFLKLRDSDRSPLVVLTCARTLPYEAQVTLVWDKGIESFNGIKTSSRQELSFKVRKPFEASFSCQRANRQAQCVPLLPMSLSFSAPVPMRFAEKVFLVGPGGKIIKPDFDKGVMPNTSVDNLSFKGPFSEKALFKIKLPPEFKDDAGRVLRNAASFPLVVRTDSNPPLVKFSAQFGILESRAYADGIAAIPVTVRNVEPQLAASAATSTDERIAGQALTIAPGKEIEVVRWLRRLKEADNDLRGYNLKTKREEIISPAGAYSIFSNKDPRANFVLPKPLGKNILEVIGIPVKMGFHVIELKSPRLGASLLKKQQGKQKPYYVRTSALVTNLSVHFKLGRESSLVWVTSLDRGEPVPGAEVTVRDCSSGSVLWSGKTDSQGMAGIEKELPGASRGCMDKYDAQYFVSARVGDDFSFDLSEWNGGIASWRFNLPGGGTGNRSMAHAIFDRTLLRAGETVHMKLIVRQPKGQGFVLPEMGMLGDQLTITHLGSDQTWDIPLTWDRVGSSVTDFAIPKDAKQGTYQVTINTSRNGLKRNEAVGNFRVEEFRVPTMRVVLHGPATPAVNATEIPVDVQVSYLSGGGAMGQMVKLRGQLEPRQVSFPGYDEFTLGNGSVKEGVQTNQNRGDYAADEDGYEEDGEGTPENERSLTKVFQTHDLILDDAGGGRVHFDKLPRVDKPMALLAELEYRDANGETLTAATRVPLWPADIVLGIKSDSWLASKDLVKFQVLALDVNGKPAPGVAISTDVLQSQFFSHRRRLIGGFYAYEHGNEVKQLAKVCSGVSDSHGTLFCEFKPTASGNLILRTMASDAKGNAAYAHADTWVPGEDNWFAVEDNDRIDLLPEKRRYEPNDTARFQIRMPFSEANVLVTVEREGILDSFVRKVSRSDPVIDVPIKGSYSPNIFVSAFAVRGRVGTPAPTAMVDLGKPAYKMGIASIEVGWRAHELKVDVAAQQPVYRVRDKASVTVRVQRADGKPLPAGTEVAVAAVDEGLLELMPNDSWKLLDAMMQRRGIEVQTSTAQMQVIGKRHFGRKSQALGGGGGHQSARELFDTLLLWQGRVKLDAAGVAKLQVPLNDSLSSFKIVAIAHGGADLFGTGATSIRTTQDLILLSGLPPVVREQDRYRALFTVRNASDHTIDTQVSARMGPAGKMAALPTQTISLPAGAAQDVAWDVRAPVGASQLQWEVEVKGSDAEDRMKLAQKVIQAIPVRTFQATITQLTAPFTLPIEIPRGAIVGRGGIDLSLQASLVDNLGGVREYMNFYPYTCLEQRASRAVALRSEVNWKAVMGDLPSYLDRDGLAKYFPSLDEGSDVLTAYLLAIANEAQYDIPASAQERMEKGLVNFIEGRIVRSSAVPSADLSLRKLAAMEALSRGDTEIRANWLDSVSIQPNLWPTSVVLDWYHLLQKLPKLPQRDERQAEAERILRSRLNFQGTTMGFSTERSDALWWLMMSGDTNANRMITLFLNNPKWREDMPRLVRGALSRQQRGHWETTVANAWGVLAMEKFSAAFEVDPVTGKTKATLGSAQMQQDWQVKPKGDDALLSWPGERDNLTVQHTGNGKPWATVRSMAAIPLEKPFSSGYHITRTVIPIEQKTKGEWHRGDVYRVHLEIDAQSDMGWVVVDDPVPAGAAILGTGLGRDSKILSKGEKREGWVWPAYEERTFTAFRAYYSFVPRGKWTVEYTVRLNNPGEFLLPQTHVEAMYAPEMFGEAPNATLKVEP